MDRRSALVRNFDVLVVGGGAAGVATAVSAARLGARVVLVEKYGFCGGGAVAGLSGTVCGLYAATDRDNAAPEQIVHGFAAEFVDLLAQRGGVTAPMRYGKTHTLVHDPLVWKEAADFLLRQHSVDVIYHATVIGTLVDGGERVEGVNVYTKEGPLDIRAHVVVDASGDADVLAMGGFESFQGHDGRVQNPTMIFRLLGVDVGAFQERYGADTILPPDVSAAIAAADKSGAFSLPRHKIWAFPTTRPGELLCNCTRITGADGRELNTLRMDDFTEAEILGRAQAREYARFFQETMVGCEDSFINDTATQVGIRQTRQVLGRSMLTNNDVVQGTKFSDGIARSPWPIELHSGTRPKIHWLLDDYYEVPYGCFVPERARGLLMAGRCLSAQHEAVASARVTAQCFSYGQAIGVAAGMAVKDGILPHEIAGTDVRLELNRFGAAL